MTKQRFEFLSPENDAKARAELDRQELDYQSYVSWWGIDEVTLDGEFSLADLKRIVALMESFAEVSGDD